MAQRTQPAKDSITVQKDGLQQVFTKEQWEALGPNKGGWIPVVNKPKEVLELEQKQTAHAKYELKHQRISELVTDLEMGYSQLTQSVVYSHPLGTVDVPVEEIEDAPAEAWPYMVKGIKKRIELLNSAQVQVESALKIGKENAGAKQDPAPVTTGAMLPEKEETQAAAAALEGNNTTAATAPEKKKGGRPKSKADEGEE